MQDLLNQLLDQARGMWRFRRPALIAAWIVCLVGWLVVLLLPRAWRSYTVVLAPLGGYVLLLLVGRRHESWRKRSPHLLELRACGHLLGEQGGLDAVEEPAAHDQRLGRQVEKGHVGRGGRFSLVAAGTVDQGIDPAELRDGKVEQITDDHTVYNELVRRGKLSKEQIEKVAQKNAITRAVGVYEHCEPETLVIDVAETCWWARRYQESAAACDRAIEMAPDQAWAYLAKVYNLFSWKGKAGIAEARTAAASIADSVACRGRGCECAPRRRHHQVIRG